MKIVDWLHKILAGRTEIVHMARTAQFERRCKQRVEDGSTTDIIVSEGWSVAARILDVSENGARIFSEARLPQDGRVNCRIQCGGRSVYLGLAILWKKRLDAGFEYGLSYGCRIPGTEQIMSRYLTERLAAA